MPGDASIDVGVAMEAGGDGTVRRAALVAARLTRGPLLPADEYAGYVRAHPPAGDELLALARTSVTATHERASQRQDLRHDTIRRGMTYVFVLALVMMLILGGLAFFLIDRGEIVVGTIVGVADVVVVVLVALANVWNGRDRRRPSGAAPQGLVPIVEPERSG